MYRMTQRWLGLLLPIHERLDAVYSMVLVVPFSCLLLVVILLSRMLMFWIAGFLLFLLFCMASSKLSCNIQIICACVVQCVSYLISSSCCFLGLVVVVVVIMLLFVGVEVLFLGCYFSWPSGSALAG